MRADIVPGATFPDYELPDHTGKHRTLSEIQQGDPLIVMLSRGNFCPKDRRQLEGLALLHRELEVGYCRLVTISSDNLLETNEMRTGVAAHWPFLSDPARKVQKDLDIAEYTDPTHNPDDPAHAGARARAGGAQDLQRLLVLRPPHRRGAPPGPARGAAEVPPRLGHHPTRAQGGVGARRQGRASIRTARPTRRSSPNRSDRINPVGDAPARCAPDYTGRR